MTPTPRWHRAAEWAFLAALIGFGFLLAFRPNWDIDIFWHIATGQWIVTHGRLPNTDIFTYTDPERPWSSFQWLYQVLSYEMDSRTSFVWIRILHAGLFVATFVAWVPILRRVVPGRTVAAALVMLGVALSLDRLRVRPEAFNFLFLAAAMPWLLGLRDRVGGARGYDVAAVAVLSALWASIHAGGAVLLPLALGAVAAGRFVDWLASGRTLPTRKALEFPLILGAVSTLVMLPMPGFVQGLLSARSMVQVSAALIPEWQPPVAYLFADVTGPLTPHHLVCGALPYLVLLLAGLAAIGLALRLLRRQAPAGDVGLLALAILMAVLATRTARFIYLDLLALAALAGHYRERLGPWTRRPLVRWSMVAVALLLAWFSYDQSVRRERHGLTAAVTSMAFDQQPGTFPEQATQVMATMGLKGRIFHLSAWGGYLLHRLYPDCRVFSDGRGNFSVRERDLMVLAHRPWERAEHLEALHAEFPFDIVLFPPPMFPLKDWDATRWVRIYAGPDAEVFLRRSPENQRNLERAAAYWRLMGLRFEDIDEMQVVHRRMTAAVALSEPATAGALAEADALTRAPESARQATGWFRGGVIRFEAGLWEGAAWRLDRALSLGMRHDTAALYLVWALTLQGNPEAARQAFARHFMDPRVLAAKDRGPLNAAARRILALLADRLSLAAPQWAPDP